jgi:hypothetical protein
VIVIYLLLTFFKFSVQYECIPYIGQKIVWNHPPHFNIGFMRKSVSTYAVGLETACDITSEGDYPQNQDGPSDHSIHTDVTTTFNRRQ